MNPLTLLGLVQLGLNIWGSMKANEEASRQAALVQQMLDIRNRRFDQAVAEAQNLANVNMTGGMSPFYAAALRRLNAGIAADAGLAGLSTSGLAQAALADARANVGAQFAQNAAQVAMQQRMPLLDLLSRGAVAGTDELSYRSNLIQQTLPQGGGLQWLAPLINYYLLQSRVASGQGRTSASGAGGIPANVSPLIMDIPPNTV